MTPKQRFLYIHPSNTTQTRIFMIHSMIDQDEGHREVLCKTEEIVTSGIGAT